MIGEDRRLKPPKSLGDALVSEDRRLRPSRSFLYLVTGEITPESYPAFAIEEFREEFGRYCDRHVGGQRRRDLIRRMAEKLWPLAIDGLIQAILFNDRLRVAADNAPRSGMGMDGGSPRSIAIARSLG
jgi:hypothetical protein